MSQRKSSSSRGTRPRSKQSSKRATAAKRINRGATPKISRWWAIHDNGGRPWIVELDRAKGHVSVIRQKENPPWILQYPNVAQLWPGAERNLELTGNTILLVHDDNNQWTFINRDVELFSPVIRGERVLEFFSAIGNSDVPYPVIVTDRHLYFPIEHQYVRREDVPAEVLADPYEEAYQWKYSQEYHEGKAHLGRQPQEIIRTYPHHVVAKPVDS